MAEIEKVPAMKRHPLFLLVPALFLHATNAADVRCIEPSGGASRCVVVGPAALAHTAQVMGIDPKEGGAILNDQIKATLANLDAALKSGGTPRSSAERNPGIGVLCIASGDTLARNPPSRHVVPVCGRVESKR